MNDTPDVMNERFLKMIMSYSGEDRLRMGCSMYGMARKMVENSIRERKGSLVDKEMKKAVFLRFYAFDFSEKRKKKICTIWE